MNPPLAHHDFIPPMLLPMNLHAPCELL
jgi:hypothetical protein